MRKALYIMGILDDSDVQWMSETGSRNIVPPGQILIRAGEMPTSLFILLEGRLSVQSHSREVASLFSGEIVGEISFVDSKPPSTSVIAAEDCKVLAIPRNLLSARLEHNPGFAARFYRSVSIILADRLRVTTARLGAGGGALSADDQETVEELDVELMDSIAMAALRFDRMLKE